jgi:protein tyrosine phosphatase
MLVDIKIKNEVIYLLKVNKNKWFKFSNDNFILLGPLQNTVKDFWRMIWQENITIIVMTTNIRESGTMKCYPYWPLETGEYLNTGSYQIQNEKSDKYDSFVVTTLYLRKKNCSETRTIYHAHYLKWPDHGVPTGTRDALLFLEKVEYYKELTQTKAPILLHCSAGIGRTGTFCAIDIGIKQYLNENIIDIPSTVVKMRHERAGSVQTEDQYLFAYLALMDYIKQHQENILMNSKKSLETNHENTSPLFNSHRVKTLSDSSQTSSIPEHSFIEQIPSINTNGIETKLRI